MCQRMEDTANIHKRLPEATSGNPNDDHAKKARLAAAAADDRTPVDARAISLRVQARAGIDAGAEEVHGLSALENALTRYLADTFIPEMALHACKAAEQRGSTVVCVEDLRQALLSRGRLVL